MQQTNIELRPLNSILIEAQSPKLIDFFSLDVEGMEMNVLNGINFSNFNFKYLLVECANENKFKEIFNFLKNKNYQYLENLTEWDILFKFNKND